MFRIPDSGVFSYGTCLLIVPFDELVKYIERGKDDMFKKISEGIIWSMIVSFVLFQLFQYLSLLSFAVGGFRHMDKFNQSLFTSFTMICYVCCFYFKYQDAEQVIFNVYFETLFMLQLIVFTEFVVVSSVVLNTQLLTSMEGMISEMKENLQSRLTRRNLRNIYGVASTINTLFTLLNMIKVPNHTVNITR